MSRLSILSFQYNLAKLRFQSGRVPGRLLSDLSTYTPDEEETKKVFDIISRQGGAIYEKDLQSLLERLGKADAAAEARRMIAAVDRKNDGCVDLEEFLEVHKNGVQLGDIRRAFFYFDADGDGRISAEEVREVLRKLGESYSLEQCRTMVKAIDRNGDGFVDMDDFMSMMTRPRRKP